LVDPAFLSLPLNFYESSRFVHPQDGRPDRHNGQTDKQTN